MVTGIGHEDDLTIADLVADLRALTPTEAAERVVPERAKVLEWLAGLEARLRARLVHSVEVARARLDDLASRRALRRPLDRVRQEEHRLDEWAERLQRAMRQRLTQSNAKLEAAAARLSSLSPLHVLGRGYSLTRRQGDGVVVRSTEDVRPGDTIVTLLASGELQSRVEGASPEGASR